jgi:hypothetical protein
MDQSFKNKKDKALAVLNYVTRFVISALVRGRLKDRGKHHGSNWTKRSIGSTAMLPVGQNAL